MLNCSLIIPTKFYQLQQQKQQQQTIIKFNPLLVEKKILIHFSLLSFEQNKNHFNFYFFDR